MVVRPGVSNPSSSNKSSGSGSALSNSFKTLWVTALIG
jgi:hypothetical protein